MYARERGSVENDEWRDLQLPNFISVMREREREEYSDGGRQRREEEEKWKVKRGREVKKRRDGKEGKKKAWHKEIFFHVMGSKRPESPCDREDRRGTWGVEEERKEGYIKERRKGRRRLSSFTLRVVEL